MKRSTLTLSILTALLVSACGGSSSNDEQTKDPTPPKVTPTQPTTPSTGKTPTTGNKGNAGSSAGSSAASSSSSDPTPPISSGSAPSGGKPIVIKAETHEEKTPEEGKKTPQQELETLKALQEQIEALKIKVGKSKKEKDNAFDRLRKLAITTTDSQNQNSEKSEIFDAWDKQDKLRKAFLGQTAGLGLNETNDAKAAIETIRQALENTPDASSDLKKQFAAYEQAYNRWQDKKAQIPELEKDWKTKTKQYIENKKKLAELEVKAGLANADGFQADVDYYNMKQQEIELQYKADLKEAKYEQLAFAADRAEKDKNTLSAELADLKLAEGKAKPGSKEKAEFQERIKELAPKVKEKEKLETDLKSQAADAESEKNTASNEVKSVTDQLKKLAKALGYRGVAVYGGVTDKFAAISKVEHNTDNSGSNTDNSGSNTDKWKLTFADGSSKELDIGNSNNFTKSIKRDGDNQTVYGKFDTSKGLAAYQRGNQKDSGTDENSIYGYIGSKFYSVGKATPLEEIQKLTIANYKGKALLQAKDKSGLIADFKANVDFKGGKVKGYFNNFASYDRNDTGANSNNVVTANGKLPESLKDVTQVDFDAQIKGNKFVTEKAPENEASVYGYFYGDKAQEAGGLVEYKDVFHGSFGGAQ